MAGSVAGGRITAPQNDPRSTIMSGRGAPMMGGKGGGQAIAPSQGFNVNQAAAGALESAMQGTAAGMGYQPQAVLPTSYQAQTAQASGYRPSTMQSQGYGATGPQATGFQAANVGSQGYRATGPQATGFQAANVGSQGYRATGTGSTGYDAFAIGESPTVSAQNVRAGQLARSDLSAYTNPYESQVVDQSLADIERSRLMQQNQLGAQASAAGAFGGSRQAIAEAETNRAFADQAARTAASLRQAGFTQAQQMAQQDIGTAQQAALANQQANLQAGTTTAGFGQQSNLANQAALNAASQFGAASQNQAMAQTAAARNAAAQFGASAANQAAMQQSAQQQAAAQFGAGAQNAASQQLSAAQNAASQFGASAANQAAMQQSAQRQAAAQFGAGAQNVASQQLAAARNAASQFGASAANQSAATNMAAQNAAAQFGAGAQNQMALSNMAALNQAGQFGAQQGMAAQLANQSAAMQANQARLGAAAQMGVLGQQAFNTSGAIQDRQAQQGLMQQGLQQALIDAARNQFAGYASSPSAALAAPLAALGVTPTAGGTTTSSSSPGLFDYLGLGAGLYAASDIRLKENIRPAGKMNGIKFYTWDWNEKGKKVAAFDQPSAGVIADEIQETHPHLVKRGADGYLRVNYAGLASEMAEV